MAGSGNTFYIRPVAMRPDDYKIVAAALHDVLQNATASADTAADGGAEPAAPEGDASGSWEVTVTYTSGAPKQHRFTIAQDKLGALAGVHSGSITESPLTGQVSGTSVSISSELPSPGGGGNNVTMGFGIHNVFIPDHASASASSIGTGTGIGA